MSNLFSFLTLISLFLFIIGLIKPTIFGKLKITNRKRSSLIFGGLFLLFFILVGITTDAKPRDIKDINKEQKKISQNIYTLNDENSTSTEAINYLNENNQDHGPTDTAQTSSSSDNRVNEGIQDAEPSTGNSNNRQVDTVQFDSQTKNNNSSNLYKVVEVVDGDTIKVSINNEITTLRLIGIDTPETKDPRKTVQCFGVEASNKAKSLLSNKYVRLEGDVKSGEYDKYQRLLRYVFLQDGTDFNLYMIRNGYAHEYTYNGVQYKYQKEFKDAENYAKNNKLGLWSPETCNGDTLQSAQTETVKTTTSSTQPASSKTQIPVSSENPPVKKSTSNICHQINISPYYKNTTHFTAYNTLQECLDSGGRLPN